MKVAYVVHRFPRLHNTYLLNEITALRELGVEVSIIALGRTRETVLQDAASRLAKTVEHVDDFPRSVDFDPDPGPLSGVRDVLESRVRDAVPAIARALVDRGVQVIHGALGNRPATTAMLLGHISGLPFTFTAHAFDLFVDFPLAREKIDRAAFMTTISEYNRRYLVECLGAPREKVHVTRVGPDRAVIDAIRAERPARERARIVSCCRLHPIKGLADALAAVALVRETLSDVSYTIAGGGELEDELPRRARELGIEDRVVFTGDVTNIEACREIARAAVFLQPSVIAPNGDRDGVPTSMIEALALETPVVSTRVSGIPELVEHGANGWLEEPGDVRGTADRLIATLGDPRLARRMGEAGRRQVEQTFDSRRSAAEFVEAWKKCSTRPANHPRTSAAQAGAASHEFRGTRNRKTTSGMEARQ